MPQEVGNGSHNLITTDAGDIYDYTIRALEAAVGEPLYPGDERRIFAEALVAVLLSSYNTVEDCAHQKSLRFARGEVLDALGERLGVTRLAGAPAKCTLRFTASEAQENPIRIPKWTKATADSDVYFATDQDATIPPGDLTVEVPATATAPGSMGNGYPPATVSTLVDLIAYIDAVENVNETAGGDDGELYTEAGDDRFRERIRIAPSHLSVAGPEKAYIYWAKTADAGIADVAAISETETYQKELTVENGKVYMGGDLLLPNGLTVNDKDEGFSYTYEDSLLTITLDEPLSQEETVTVKLRHKMDGRVRIVPLMDGGEIPDEIVLQKVADAVNAKDVRPMTDVVTVEAPTRVEFGIAATYWTTPENESATYDTIEGAGGAIERFVADQTTVLGRDINPDVLKTYMIDPDWADAGPGAIRVEISQPSYIAIEDGQVAHFNGELSIFHKLETEARWDK